DQSLATSTSQDRRIRTADIAFGWNVLDFGLSYVRARQAADKALIQNELRRKITLRIIEDVGAAYWRAVSAQRLLGRLSVVEGLARQVESEARGLAADKETSAITALTYQREVVEIQRTLGEITREFNTALTQLGALMNVAPGTRFKVVDSRRSIPRLPSARMSDLLHTAVMSRPELREVEYRKRINEHEAHAALLELLPGLQLFAGDNFDSNTFLFANQWQNWGAKASWNLIKVFSYPTRRDVIDEQDNMLDKRSLAVTMTIMTQVYVSRIRYAHAVKEYGIAKRYRDVQRDLLMQIRAESAAGRVARQTLVREELNAVVAEAKLDLQFAALQAAFANIHTSLGAEPMQGHEHVGQGASVAALAGALRSTMSAQRMADVDVAAK
ncbi:MAG: TolC family protein, partial [Hyphomicrobium sp.]